MTHAADVFDRMFVDWRDSGYTYLEGVTRIHGHMEHPTSYTGAVIWEVAVFLWSCEFGTVIARCIMAMRWAETLLGWERTGTAHRR